MSRQEQAKRFWTGCLAAAIVGIAGYYFFSRVPTATKDDIASIDVPLKEQQQALLKYQKLIECQAHGPCFYAYPEKKYHVSLKKCEDGLKLLETAEPPANLPPKVRKILTRARDALKEDNEWLKKSAENSIHLMSHRRPLHRLGMSANTCEAYPLIRKLNVLYGVDTMMQGQSINCEVLAEVK